MNVPRVAVVLAVALLACSCAHPTTETVKTEEKALDAREALTNYMFLEISLNGDLGRAEALKRSMKTLMADRDNPHFSHPLFWAPFVVVGEGGSWAANRHDQTTEGAN